MKNKKTVVVVIVIVAILLLIVASWLIYTKFFKKQGQDQTKKESNDVPLAADDSGSTPAPSQTSTPVANGPADVKAFQDWMDANHPNWVKGKNLNKGSGYGSFGPSTQRAWGTYKDEYTKPKAVVVSPVNPVNTKKNIPLFAKSAGTPLYSNVNDLIPVRLAGKNEDLGNVFVGQDNKAVMVSSYSGKRFWKLLLPGGEIRYVAFENAKFSQFGDL